MATTKWKIRSVGEDVKKLELSYIVGGHVKWFLATVEISVTLPVAVKHRAMIWPKNSIPRYVHKRPVNRYSNKNLYMNVHSTIIHNIQNV